MNMKTEVIPPCKMAYIRRNGPYGSGNVLTMEKLKKWAGEKNLLHDKSVVFGIAHDNPETELPQNCSYDACIVIPDEYRPDDGNIRLGELQGGKYAVFTINHTAEAVSQAWGQIYPALEKEKLRFDTTRPVLERYAAAMIANHLCEICIPVH